MTDSTDHTGPEADPAPPHRTRPLARVVLLTGPSGSGKSRLAARTGLPVLRLDDFYKEGGDPTLPLLEPKDGARPGSEPKSPPAGVDWDSPLAWDAASALETVTRLCTRGSADVPLYSISASARTGTQHLSVEGSPLFVAEGIFAADLATACAESGLLADALCLSGSPLTTFRRRLLRDVREARKSLPVLVRRGWRLLRAEGAIVERHVRLGAFPCGREEAAARIEHALASVTGPAPAGHPTPPAHTVPRPREANCRTGAGGTGAPR